MREYCRTIESIGIKCFYKFMGDVDLLVFWISMFTKIHPYCFKRAKTNDSNLELPKNRKQPHIIVLNSQLKYHYCFG